MLIQVPSARANIVNVIRFDHGMDVVEAQMWEILKRGLPATWLLQYDAMVAGPYVEFLKEHIAEDHEIGLWFEVNRRQCQDVGVDFRGEIPDPADTFDTENWDHHAQAKAPCGYFQEERIKLIDTMMRKFFSIFERFPLTVAGGYIDSFSLHYLAEKYHICASANTSDRWKNNECSIWGAPYHGFYYPSKTSAIMAATSREFQTHVPIFRMRGNDPVNSKTADMTFSGLADHTLEPSCPTGGADPEWVQKYFDMMLDELTLPFPYFQIGHDNSCSWDHIGPAYCFQLDELIRRRDRNQLVIETLKQTGQFVQQHYPETPIGVLNAKINLRGLDARAIWYHSKHYRAQVLYSPNSFEIVDLYRYSSEQMGPFYHDPVCTWNATFMALPVVDSFLFGSSRHLSGTLKDGRHFDERHLPIFDVRAYLEKNTLTVTYHNSLGIRSRLSFSQDCIQADRWSNDPVTFNEMISFDPQARWNPLQGVYRNQIVFGWNNYDYRLTVKEGLPSLHPGRAQLLLRSLPRSQNVTTTLFVFPCAADCFARACRE